MKRHRPDKETVYSRARALALLLAVLLFADSLAVIFTGPLNLGSFLPGILGIVIAGAVLLRRQLLLVLRTKAGKAIAWAAGAVIGVNIILFIIFFTLTLTSGGIPPGYKPDAVIVLGAGLIKDHVSITLAARLDAAVTYYQSHPGVPIVVSGGQGPGEIAPEAAVMAKYLETRGIPAVDIIQEARSSDTEENFAFSRDILTGVLNNDKLKIIYITNQFHMYRAGLYAKKARLTAEGLAAPSLPRYVAPNLYAREYFALIKYWLFRRS